MTAEEDHYAAWRRNETGPLVAPEDSREAADWMGKVLWQDAEDQADEPEAADPDEAQEDGE